jgi:putative phosphoesterase
VLIGILSDTHGSLSPGVKQALAGVEHILHAGDIGGQWLLDELAEIAPVQAVLGNCDWSGDYLDVPESQSLQLDGLRIFMTHKPADLEAALRGRGAIAAGQPLPNIAIHGHTHIPRQEHQGSVLLLCPGSPTRPRATSPPSIMLLKTTPSRVAAVEVVEITA